MQASEIASFQDFGFLKIEDVLFDSEIDMILDYYNDTIKLFDRGEAISSKMEIISREFIYIREPERVKKLDLLAPIIDRFKGMAAQLLEVDGNLLQCTSRVFHKPARGDTPTPWHQDEAYRPAEVTYSVVNFWIPLQDVDIESGCLYYIPASHKAGIVEHCYVPAKHGGGLALTAANVNYEQAVAVPLALKSVVCHHPRALHYSGANKSNLDRKVLVFVFEGPHKENLNPDVRPWQSRFWTS